MSLVQVTARDSEWMYGLESFEDAPALADYNPWEHADLLGAPVVTNPTIPGRMVAAYSARRHVIFLRPNTPYAVERCALAHELVHFEHRDRGTTNSQEDRADRISTLRLIRPRRLMEAAQLSEDIGAMAIELCVTEKVMRLYARMVRNGTLPGGH